MAELPEDNNLLPSNEGVSINPYIDFDVSDGFSNSIFDTYPRTVGYEIQEESFLPRLPGIELYNNELFDEALPRPLFQRPTETDFQVMRREFKAQFGSLYDKPDLVVPNPSDITEIISKGEVAPQPESGLLDKISRKFRENPYRGLEPNPIGATKSHC